MEADTTIEEEVGFLILADAWQALSHLRDAYSKKPGSG